MKMRKVKVFEYKHVCNGCGKHLEATEISRNTNCSCGTPTLNAAEPIMVEVEEGYFHRFSQEFEEYESGPGNYTVAIIEVNNKGLGEIKEVPSNLIKFKTFYGCEPVDV
jgi:hypothetical protein